MSDEELYKSELKEAMQVERFVESTEEVKCRICWDNNDEVENPLINACTCKGSVGLIHFRCLRKWILS
jgi:E3 ubiquitin-protein ligase DOA10